jgi:hypothetical protein
MKVHAFPLIPLLKNRYSTQYFVMHRLKNPLHSHCLEGSGNLYTNIFYHRVHCSWNKHTFYFYILTYIYSVLFLSFCTISLIFMAILLP